MKFDENGKAMIYFFNTCKDAIRTIPLMMYDEHKVEDLDSDLEDHACDEVRYFCMMRPIAPRVIETKMKPMHDPLNQYAEHGKYHKYNAIRRG
jgi:nitrate reductase beta subunit